MAGGRKDLLGTRSRAVGHPETQLLKDARCGAQVGVLDVELLAGAHDVNCNLLASEGVRNERRNCAQWVRNEAREHFRV